MDWFIGLVALFFFFITFYILIIFKTFILINLFYFILFYLFIYLFLSFFFFLPFLLNRVADRVLVLQLGVRPEPLWWESRVQDTGPPETSRLQVISIGERSPRDLLLNAKTQLHSMGSKLQYWTPHANQLARQGHNHTH